MMLLANSADYYWAIIILRSAQLTRGLCSSLLFGFVGQTVSVCLVIRHAFTQHSPWTTWFFRIITQSTSEGKCSSWPYAGANDNLQGFGRVGQTVGLWVITVGQTLALLSALFVLLRLV